MRDDERTPRRHLGVAGRGRVTCASVADVLPALAMGETDVRARVRRHVEACLRCQAEMARYRRMRRGLLALRDQPVVPAPMVPPMLTTMVFERLDAVSDSDPDHAERAAPRVALQVACVGGISMATVAGALVWLTRRRLAPAGC